MKNIVLLTHGEFSKAESEGIKYYAGGKCSADQTDAE